MKIILVNKFHYLKGGSETYYFGLAEGLKAAGHEVHFFAMEGDKNLPCEDADLFVSAKDYNGPSSLTQKVSAAASLIYSNEAKEKFQALCERVQPDVVHMNLVHRQITLSILDAPYLKEHGVPVLFTAHDYILVCPNYLMLDGRGSVCDACLGGKFSSCLKRKCVKGSTAKSAMAFAEAEYLRLSHAYNKIDKIVCPSSFMAQKTIEGGLESNRVSHMTNFCSAETLEQAHSDFDGTDYKSPYLLFFGRLSKEKGVDLLIDAFASIEDMIPDWRLVIVGDGPEREALAQRVENLSCKDRIEFAGYQTGAPLQKYVERASLAIACSRCRENMPYSIVEAFASGTPIVGARIGGIPELVREGETGFACEPDDSHSLADAIIRGVKFIGDKDTYRDMQQKCRDYVLNNCDQSKYIEQLTGLYQELVDSKKRG